MHALDEDSQTWILESMRTLAARGGLAPWISNPLLFPKAAFFPDAYSSPAGAVQVVARRLLSYADIYDVEVEVHDLSPPEKSLTPLWEVIISELHETKSTVIIESIGAPGDLPGALSSEIARVVRRKLEFDRNEHMPYRDQNYNDEDLEKMLAPLTAVYLGWGVLAANAAYLVKTAGTIEGNLVGYHVDSAMHGDLHWNALCYALAIYCIVRGQNEENKVAKALRPNQASAFKYHVKTLRDKRETLLSELALPEESQWPAPSSHPKTNIRFNENPSLQQGLRSNHNRPVFRVRCSRELLCGGASSLIGAVAGAIIGGPALLLGFATGATLGVALGKNLIFYKCSDPYCQANLKLEDTQCQDCGGIVAGEIKSISERLDAEDALPATWWTDHGLEPPEP